jgi:hypothetical protein
VKHGGGRCDARAGLSLGRLTMESATKINVPLQIRYIDAIARDKQRDVLYL